jgi:hypothetical protein
MLPSPWNHAFSIFAVCRRAVFYIKGEKVVKYLFLRLGLDTDTQNASLLARFETEFWIKIE